jgi:hypothetical protein
LSERRLAQRVPVRLSAIYRSPTTTAEGMVTCLSRHGLFFEVRTGDGVGTSAVIDLRLPKALLSLVGRVVRRHDGAGGIGFRFADLGDDTRRQIANIVLSAHSAT